MGLKLNTATDIGAVLAKVLDGPMIAQANRVSKMFEWLPRRAYAGKQVDWRIMGTGRTVTKVASGADAPAADEDGRYQPTLGWGRYATTVNVAHDALVAAMGAGESAIMDLLGQEFVAAAQAIASEINGDFYDGTGSNSIIGLATAIAASTTEYASVDTGVTVWGSQCVGTGQVITLDLVDQAQQALVASGAGLELGEGDAWFTTPAIWRKWAQLADSDGGGRTLTAPINAEEQPRLTSAAGRSALFHDGAKAFRDKDARADYVYGLRRDQVEFRYMPMNGLEDVAQDDPAPMFQVTKLGKTGSAAKFEVSLQGQLVVKSRNAHVCLNVTDS